MRIVGINAYHPDAAACVVVDGVLVAAVEEERFSRIKHWAGFPTTALGWCLAEVGGDWSLVEAVAVARLPRAHLLRKAALALSHPRSLGRAVVRVRNLAALSSLEKQVSSAFGMDRAPRIVPVEHHLAHIASAFLAGPFEEAACLSVDGFGDFVSAMLAKGSGSRIEVLERVHFPHSLGLFYTAMTQYLGFPHFGDEYKAMGLAAYGEPRFVAEIGRLVPPSDSGLFRLDLSYFRHLSEGVDMTWENGEPSLGPVFTPTLERLLGPARRPDDELTQRHMDLAASMQRVYEERFFALVRRVLKLTASKRLALAGGCALNSLANGKLFEQTDVQDIFIQSAAGDAGTSFGAALWAHHAVLGRPRGGWTMEHSAWGPAFDEAAVRRALAEKIPGSKGKDGRYGELEIRTARDEEDLCRDTAAAIAAGEVVGWFQGRAEWGPRALGHRSILADPRRGDMKEILNLKIKRRESFRPFAPSILAERAGEWFTCAYPDPFMLKVYPFRPEKRALVPAVAHVDGTGRLQTVSREGEPLYWRLIRAFEGQTGVPMVLNTSFNENEPIVNRPEEAIDCFLRTRMDRLVMGTVAVVR